MKSKKFKIILNLITLVILGLIIYLNRAQLLDVLKNIREANALFLLLVIPLQIVNYHSYTRMYQETFDLLGSRIGYWDTLKVAFELNFVNYILPSAGLSGFGYFSLRMRNLGVRASRSAIAQTVRWLITFGSFVPLLLLGLFLLALHNSASNLVILTAAGISFGIIILFLIVFFLLEKKDGLKKFTILLLQKLQSFINFFKSSSKQVDLLSKKRLASIDRSFQTAEEDYQVIRRNWKSFVYTGRWGILANLTEVSTIAVCFAALGLNPVWGAIVISYGVANIAGFISILPGGIGVYETLMTAILVSAGVPPAVSLTATLMYRVLTAIFAIPIGYYFYSRAFVENPEKTPKPFKATAAKSTKNAQVKEQDSKTPKTSKSVKLKPSASKSKKSTSTKSR